MQAEKAPEKDTLDTNLDTPDTGKDTLDTNLDTNGAGETERHSGRITLESLTGRKTE